MPQAGSAESMFEAALDALDSPVMVHGPDAILLANRAAAQVLRARDKAELVGLPITSIVHPDGLEAGRLRRELILEHGQTMLDVPLKLRTLDGEALYLRALAKPIPWFDGTAILIVASAAWDADAPPRT